MNCYTLVTYPRQEGRGGGVGIYISNKHPYQIRHDLMKRYDRSHCESIFIEIKLNNKTFIIDSLYKPPNTNINSFNDELLSILNSISREKKHSIIMGDFNLNLINTNSRQVNDFTNNMYATGFYPTISKPTRIVNDSATIIYNIFTNITQHKIHSGILYTEISDHLPVLNIYDICNLPLKPGHKTLYRRIKSGENLVKLKIKIKWTNWDDVYNESNPDASYNAFINILNTLLNECLPIKQIKLETIPVPNG